MRTLFPSEIDVRVSSIKENGLQLLLYKTARVDMSFLDELYTPFGWSCEYSEIKGNLFCGISVKTEHGWVTKWDCGIESRESGGNEKKGEASDAFKRAGTKWGIGRELYTAPFIWVSSEKANIKKDARGNFVTHDRFSVEIITIENGNIVELVIKNNNTGKNVYSMIDNQGPDAQARCSALSEHLGLDDKTKAKLWTESGKQWCNLEITLKAMKAKQDASFDNAVDNVQKTYGGDK